MKKFSKRQKIIATVALLATGTLGISMDYANTFGGVMGQGCTSVELGKVLSMPDDAIGGQTQDDLFRLKEVTSQENDYEFAKMLLAGRAVSLNKGQRIKLIGCGVSAVQVQIMEGELEGNSCYIPSKYLADL